MTDKVLIVGNGYAGVAAARTLAALGSASVTVVAGEASRAYCAHLLPELAAGRKEEADLLLADPREFGTSGIRFVAGARVLRLSHSAGTAILEGGGEIPFDKALIATGSKASVPEALRHAVRRCRNVIAMKRLADARALRAIVARGAARIVIVGAGRIGILLAEALRESAAHVTLVEIGPEILPTMLQEDVAARLRPAFDRPGLVVRTGSRVEEIVAEGDAARAVRISGAGETPCDAVVIATGVEPDLGFLDPGFRAADGIPVDSRMETAVKGIYAAGDVVRFDTFTGRTEPGQLVVNARRQGSVAAQNMAGRTAACPPSFTGNVVRFGGTLGARIGDTDGTDHADFRAGGSFARATLDGGTVTGIQFAGDPEDLRGLVPAVLKKFRAHDIPDALKGSPECGFVPWLAARSAAWA